MSAFGTPAHVATEPIYLSQLPYFHDDIPAFLTMANIASSSSVLVVNCTAGNLLLEVVKSMGSGHGRIVGISDRIELLRELDSTLQAESLGSNIQLFIGDLANPYRITALHHSDHPAFHATFDMVMGRNVILYSDSQFTSNLTLWRSYLATGGRIAATFSYRSDDDPLMFGCRVVDTAWTYLGQISFASEAVWVLAEALCKCLTANAGLRVSAMRRLSMQGPITTDLGVCREEQTRLGLEGYEEEEPGWFEAGGPFSADIKRRYVPRSWYDNIEKWKKQFAWLNELPGVVAPVHFVSTPVKLGVLLYPRLEREISGG